LKTFLAAQPAGRIKSPGDCAKALALAWDSLSGSSDESTSADKLISRPLENMTWHPPILSFQIERHGQTVNGSSRASLHVWNVNMDTLTASIVDRSHRQLKPTSPRVNVKPIAEMVAAAITKGEQTDFLKWKSPDDVSVKIGMLEELSGWFAQTEMSRRRRFRKALEPLLSVAGWAPVPGVHNRYVRKALA